VGSAASELVEGVTTTELELLALLALLEPLPPAATCSQNVLVAGRTLSIMEESGLVIYGWVDETRTVCEDVLRATSAPHFSSTQGVATAVRASMFLQTQAKSVCSHLVEESTASWMHFRAQSGKMSRLWAEATATRAGRIAAENFMVKGEWLTFVYLEKS
jgi:hypothetical protein